MKIKTLLTGILAGAALASCSESTGTIGSSIIPEEDILQMFDSTHCAVSRSVPADRELLVRSSDCYLGIFTDGETGVRTEADFLTQVNCTEGFVFPDSVYGIDKFHFPEWVKKELEGKKPYRAYLRLYCDEYAGSPDNALKIEIWPLTRTLSPSEYYYSDIDPTKYYDPSGEPLTSASISPVDYAVSDSILSRTGYVNTIRVALPDSVAGKMLNTFYSEDGPAKFADAPAFIENICKGFYVRCVQGDGNLLKIYKVKLEVCFYHLTETEAADTLQLESAVAEFLGNSEVLQVTRFTNSGLENLLEDQDVSYIKTPFGIYTEMTLPIDEIIDNSANIINSATMILKGYKPSSESYALPMPENLLLIMKDSVPTFFRKASLVDNITSYYTTLNAQYNEYAFNNLSRIIMKCASLREEWIELNGYTSREEGKAAYQAEHPDWNKIMLIPVQFVKDGSGSLIYLCLDQSPRFVKLRGGINGYHTPIKVIKTNFTAN